MGSKLGELWRGAAIDVKQACFGYVAFVDADSMFSDMQVDQKLMVEYKEKMVHYHEACIFRVTSTAYICTFQTLPAASLSAGLSANFLCIYLESCDSCFCFL